MDEKTEMELRNNASLVYETKKALHKEIVSASRVIEMLNLLVEKKAWTHFLTVADDDITYKDSASGFIEFMEAKPVNGLDITFAELEETMGRAQDTLRELHKWFHEQTVSKE